jgi:hypothetical protein
MIRNIPTEFDPESAIIDAELLVKYRMVNRAIEALERAIDSAPRHIALREKLRQILIETGRRDLAAQQCLALASLHISVNDMERANARLLEAKQLDPRVSVTGQLRETRKPDRNDPPASFHTTPLPSERPIPSSGLQKILTGSLADISLFDIIQIIENSKLSGEMNITASAARGQIFFREGLVVGAKSGLQTGNAALTLLTDATDGGFEFEKSSRLYEQTIQTRSNTALILDVLRSKDEANFDLNTSDLLQ